MKVLIAKFSLRLNYDYKVMEESAGAAYCVDRASRPPGKEEIIKILFESRGIRIYFLWQSFAFNWLLL